MTSIIIDEGSSHSNTLKNVENNIMRQNNADDGDDDDGDNGDNVHHRPKIHTHYLFLVHGWLGNPKEMSYFSQSIENYIIDNRQEERIKIHCPGCNVGKTNDGIANGGQRLANEIQEFIKDDFLNLKQFETESVREQNDVYCDHNDEEEKKRDDGCNGYDGDVNQNQNETNNQHQQEKHEYHVTLSLVGYSLGGLYSRFSVSCLPPKLQVKIHETKIFTIHLHFNTFMTAVTPHLGILSTKRRYKSIGRLFGQSGDDLFLVPSQRSRQNGDHKKKRRMFPLRMKRDYTITTSSEDEVEDRGLLYEMATDYERFLLPMSRFQHRIAYANAFMTDFQVPTSTAAFLSKRSIVPHYVLHKNDNNYDKSKHDDKPTSFIASTCITEQNKSMLQSIPSSLHRRSKFSFMNIKEEIKTKDLVMSSKLDALGWKKVFIDCRHMNPLKSIPSMCKSPSQRIWDDFIGERAGNGIDSSSVSLMTGSLNFVQKKSSHKELGTSTNNYVLCQAEVTSKDLYFYMNRNERIQVPTGHGLVIANSKNEPFRKFHSNGKPIADHIASKLMEKVLDY